MKYCKNCNIKHNEKFSFCPECGHELIESQEGNINAILDALTEFSDGGCLGRCEECVVNGNYGNSDKSICSTLLEFRLILKDAVSNHNRDYKKYEE